MEELTYAKKGETIIIPTRQKEIRQIPPKMDIPSYRNICIRRDTVAASLKEPVSSCSATLTLPDHVDMLEQTAEDDPMKDFEDVHTNNEGDRSQSETENPRTDTTSLVPAFVVDGRRSNGKLYTPGNGYFYRLNTSSSTQLTCTYRSCPARGTLKKIEEELFICPRKPHSCEPNPLSPQIWTLTRKIMNRCSTDLDTPFLQVFREETQSPEIPEEVREALNFEKILSAMVWNRARSKERMGLKHAIEPNICSPKPAVFCSDSQLFTDGSGYFYTGKDAKGNILHCSRGKCRGKALLSTEKGTKALFLITRRVHSCKPNLNLSQIRGLKKKMFRRSETDLTTPLHQIYCEETSSPDIPEAVLSALNYPSLSGHMANIRRLKCRGGGKNRGQEKLPSKVKSDEPKMSADDDFSGTGSSAFEITVIQAGNGKLYSDGNGNFYRISKHCVAEGDVKVSFVRCTYESCKGQAVMRRKGDHITLFHENPHTCEPNTFFQKVTALRETILTRCRVERRTLLKTIFREETSSYDLSAAVRAALNYQTLLDSMEKARGDNKKPTPKKRPKKTTSKEKSGGSVRQYVYINEDGVLEESNLDEDEVMKELYMSDSDEEDKQVKTKCIIVTPGKSAKTTNPGHRVDLGPGLPAMKIPGGHGSPSIYTDGNDYFYRKGRHTVLKGDLDTWYMSCTYEDCPGKAVMQARDHVLMLFHRTEHSCESIPCLSDLMEMKRRIMDRCKNDPITPLKQIFEEETMSTDFAPEIGALLPFDSMEKIMEKTRKSAIRAKKMAK